VAFEHLYLGEFSGVELGDRKTEGSTRGNMEGSSRLFCDEMASLLLGKPLHLEMIGMESSVKHLFKVWKQLARGNPNLQIGHIHRI
jgi:hypothetical protein